MLGVGFRTACFALLSCGALVLSACGGEDETSRIAKTGTLPTDAPKSGPKGEAKAIQASAPGVGRLVCDAQEWTEAEVRTLADVTAINAGHNVYPGALLQGRPFANGLFTPITIPRAGGKIYLTGLKLEPGAQYRRSLDVVRGDTVAQAIGDILSSGVDGTAAHFSYSLDEVHSSEQMLFAIGSDGRAFNASWSGDLSIDQKKRRNYVLLKFVQKFYDVVFVDPATATAVFRDGPRFEDPEGQIEPDNPPLYASKVSYGRMVLLLAESEHKAEDVKVALEGAYNGGVVDAKVSAGWTHGQIMSKTSVRYIVKGGDAGEAVRAINTPNAAAMFDAVKRFLGEAKNARFSAQNPGAPISYTLNYLADRSVARMSYAVDYVKQSCRPVSDAPHVYAYRLELSEIDDDVQLFLNGRLVDHHKSGRTKNWNIGGLTGGEDRIEVRLGNGGGFASSLNATLKRDGLVIDALSYETALSHTGWQLKWGWVLNKTTGLCRRISAEYAANPPRDTFCARGRHGPTP